MSIKSRPPAESEMRRPVLRWLLRRFPSVRTELWYYPDDQRQRTVVDVAAFSGNRETPVSVAVELKSRRDDHYEGPVFGLPQVVHYQRVFERVYIATNVSLVSNLISPHNRRVLGHLGVGYLWVNLAAELVHEELSPQPCRNGWFDRELFERVVWSQTTRYSRRAGAPWIPWELSQFGELLR